MDQKCIRLPTGTLTRCRVIQYSAQFELCAERLNKINVSLSTVMRNENVQSMQQGSSNIRVIASALQNALQNSVCVAFIISWPPTAMIGRCYFYDAPYAGRRPAGIV